jgi:hypothetical protein
MGNMPDRAIPSKHAYSSMSDWRLFSYLQFHSQLKSVECRNDEGGEPVRNGLRKVNISGVSAKNWVLICSRT